jgi:hypothetical protein
MAALAELPTARQINEIGAFMNIAALALPAEAYDSCNINDLRLSLAAYTSVEVQGVSPSVPKRSRGGERLPESAQAHGWGLGFNASGAPIIFLPAYGCFSTRVCGVSLESSLSSAKSRTNSAKKRPAVGPQIVTQLMRARLAKMDLSR